MLWIFDEKWKDIVVGESDFSDFFGVKKRAMT